MYVLHLLHRIVQKQTLMRTNYLLSPIIVSAHNLAAFLSVLTTWLLLSCLHFLEYLCMNHILGLVGIMGILQSTHYDQPISDTYQSQVFTLATFIFGMSREANRRAYI